jgi:hypothetical protein
MRTSSRRRLDIALMAAGSLVVGAVSLIGARAGDSERVERLWTSADLAAEGSAQVTEVIDYNFGSATGKHGIFRYVWDLSPEAPITVRSPDAPDDIEVTYGFRDRRYVTNIRIGDPNVTVSGRHRYRIGYPLPGVARGTTLDWEAVGVGWDVGIDEAEIHVVAPFELLDATCSAGTTGSQGGCEVREVTPGHLVTTVEGLDSGEGVSIEARTGSDLATPPAPPEPPATPPDDPGTGLLPPAGAAAGGALLAAGSTAWLVRRAGRERVGAGGPADAAWAGPDASTSWTRVDQNELEAMATTEFAPPAELDPPHGGIVLREEVRPEHKVAWLIQMAIDGTVDIGANGADVVGAGGPWTPSDGGDDLRLVRTGHGTPDAAAILDTAFSGRDEVELGSYDSDFARAWRHLEGQLQAWRDTSGMWDPGGRTRMVTARVLGIIGVVVGALGAAAGGALANQRGPAWLVLSAAGGALAGAGLAAAARAWELPIRTPAGSAAWLRVESFRRFLAESEAYHAEEAARRGLLREYTAWAVAVGEIDRWQRAVSAASIAPETAGLSYAFMAPLLLSSTTSAATAPSSSGGGGGGGDFGGGSVGGGAGGGGGGSW